MSGNAIVVTLEDSRRFDAAIKGYKKRAALKILHEVMGVQLVDSSFSRGTGMHDAPGVEDGSPMFDVARGIYPEDFYQGHSRDYGSGSKLDGTAFDCIFSSEAKPNARVTVYRSVEKDGPKEILPGDWVTPSRAYAKEHAEAHISGPTKILKKTVRASELFTDGNSVLEWGYHPQPDLLPTLKEGYTLQECVNGKLFPQNHLYPKLSDEQKERLWASEGFQKSVAVAYTMSSLWLDKDSANQISMLVDATDKMRELRDSGQFAEVFDALDPGNSAVAFWRVRDRECQRLVDAGLELVEVGEGVRFFAQMQPSLAQEPCVANMYAGSNPSATNKHIRSAIAEARNFPVFQPAELEAAAVQEVAPEPMGGMQR
jgi:hypothetical protein